MFGKQFVLAVVAIISLCLGGSLIDSKATTKSEPKALVSVKSDVPTDACDCANDCECCAGCACGGKVAEKQAAVEVSVVEPKLGDVQVIEGVQKTLYQIDTYQDGRRFLRWRPVRTSVSVSSGSVRVSSGPHWTYPGDIQSHLAVGHGQQVSGMSQDEMESLHDSLHEGTRVNVSTPRASVNVSSGCPGGVCPVNVNVSNRPRFRLFGR